MQIKIRVVTNAKKERILRAGDSYRVYVSQPPEGGRANTAVIKLLAEYFKTSKSNVHISSGLKSKDKTIVIKGVLTPSVTEG